MAFWRYNLSFMSRGSMLEELPGTEDVAGPAVILAVDIVSGTGSGSGR